MPWRMLWGWFLIIILLSSISAGQNPWEEKNQAGEKAFQEGHLAEASRLFTEALKEAQKFGSNDVRRAPIYNNLGLVSFVQNNFISSEVLYERAIAILEAQGQENPLLLPVLDNLTSLYVKQWAFVKAIQTSWHAYHIRDKKFGPESLEAAAGLRKLAALYFDNVRLLPEPPSNKLPPSQPPKESASGGGSGWASHEVSADFENAAAMDDVTKLSTAKSLFAAVLVLQEKAYGAGSTRLVDVLANLGETNRALGKIGAAEEAYGRAISIEEKSFGSEDPRLPFALQQLAELQTEQGNYADAEKLYREALQISDKQNAKGASLVALLTGYADLLEKMQRPDEAKSLTDRARSLGSPPTVKNASITLAGSVPYVLRFEKSVYERSTGVQKSCVLVRADGRFRVEEQQQQPTGFATAAPVIARSPDGMPDMSGLPSETFPGNRDTGNPAPKVFESSISGDSLQQLRAILSATDIREIQGSYSPRGEGSVYHNEKIAASILRDDGVQNFAFPDTSARQPYDVALKPLLQWLSTTEKHKGGAIKGATANNCSPDAPKAAPMQFSPATAKTISVADSGTVGKPVVKQEQDSVSTVKVDVNLVLVPVVVRDSQGRGIGTLRQEDFLLLDNGKPQTISRFSLEQAGGLVSAAPSASAEISGISNSSATAVKVERTVTYFFDDIHISPTDWNQVRSAADRHLSALPPGVQSGIFTTSGQITLDFTADSAKLHESLLRIQPHQVASSGSTDCPHIDTYLADLIWNHHDQVATAAVTADALNCAFGNDLRAAAAAEAMAKTTARQQLASAGAQGRIFLGSLQTALRRLAATPGRRAVVLVSPGFLAPGLEQLFNQLIDYALRSEIIFNTLDVRGLYTAESGQRYERESAIENGEILATLASATGGTSFQNNNDLIAGFDRVAAPPGYCYVLGFSPPDQELDGRFHNLAVSVNNGQQLTVQARKGYYAADRSPKPRTSESAQ